MGDIINLIGILVAIAAIWVGAKKIALSRLWLAMLTTTDFAILVVSVVAAGKTGMVVAVGANVLGALGFGLSLAVDKEDILTRAAIASGSDVKTLSALQEELRQEHRVIRHIRPLDQSRLILYLCQQARQPDEIRTMAPHLADLWIVHREDLELSALVEKFDRILRLWAMSPGDAQKLADRLATLVQRTPASLEDHMDGLIAFKAPPQISINTAHA